MTWIVAAAALCLFTPGLFTPASVSAQDEEDEPGLEAENARLGLFSVRERELLSPHLARGPVGLIEFNGEAELPAVIFAADVQAPASQIAALVSDPTGYPRFMPALDSVEIQSRRQGSIAYEWTWTTAVFTLTGSNVLTVYPGSDTRRDRPYRVESRAIGGDLGTGRFMWRIYPMSPNRSLVVLSSRVDLRDSNYVTRQLNRGQRSINRTINISLSMVMVLGAKREAERAAGVEPVPLTDIPPLHRPRIDLPAMAPMLARGDLLFMDMTGDRLNQISVVGRPGTTLDRVRQVITDPREFGPALVPGSYANVVEEREEQRELDFEWGVEIPLVGTSGRMTLHDTGTIVEIDAVEGAMRGGQWRFVAENLPWGEPIVVGWARFDPTDASWLIRAVVQGNRDFGYGIAAGAEIMVLRAIRSRAWRRHEQRAAQAAREENDG